MNQKDLKKEVAKWLTRWYGEQCDDFDEECIICQKWKLFDTLFKE